VLVVNRAAYKLQNGRVRGLIEALRTPHPEPQARRAAREDAGA
jgi:hypothetical protein